MFALRDAIALSGNDTSAVRFNDALNNIRAEIESFCSVNGDCGGGDLAIGVKIPSNWDWFEFANSYITVANEIIFPKVGSSQYLASDQVSPEIYQEWLQIPGIPLRDSRSNYTNPVPGFMEALTLPMVIGATVIFFMRFYRRRPTRSSHRTLSENLNFFFVGKLGGEVNVLGMALGLGSFLCLTTQLAALQASSGTYLYLGADTYSITCLAPFFVFFASAVSQMLND